MKKLFLLLLSVCLIQPTSWSQQSLQGIPYQAAARSLDGSLIADRTIGIQFTLYFFENESDIRTDHYTEFHRITTDALGLFRVTIGEGTPQFGEFDNIPWSSQSMWIEVALDSENSGDLVPISNSPLLSVPYALHSLSASRIAGEEDRGPGGSNSNNWHTFGNANTDPSEDFLGTSDAADLSIITDSEERLRILATGEVSIDSDLSIGNDLDVGNNTSIGNDLDVSNNTSIGNDLDSPTTPAWQRPRRLQQHQHRNDLTSPTTPASERPTSPTTPVRRPHDTPRIRCSRSNPASRRPECHESRHRFHRHFSKRR